MIPAALAANASTVWKEAGRQWLAALPRHLVAIARMWDLELGTPYELSYHWVCRATRSDGTPAVLKVGPPAAARLAAEAATLRAWRGRGAVRCWTSPRAGGAPVGAADPGTPVSSFVPHRDEEGTAAVIRLAAQREPWLVIDPHGALGDPGYDVGSWLFNPNHDDRDPRLTALVPARVE